MTKTLKTLVLKTVTVGGVKLLIPADRIGLGFTAVATYPAEVLSSGQFPLPPNPEPEPNVGPRQEPSAMQMHPQMQAGATAAAPAGSAGCLFPGSTAGSRPWSWLWSPAEGTRATAKRAAAGRLASATGLTGGSRGLPADSGRSRFPGFSGPLPQVGRDCQSPDRDDDRRTPDARRSPTGFRGAWEATPAAAAGK
jgi:hypothetical protein